MSAEGSYSQIADDQLDELEATPDSDLYDDVLDLCEAIFESPGKVQERSSAITTVEGVRFVTSVRGHHPYKIFWSRDGEGTARIEAVFPRP